MRGNAGGSIPSRAAKQRDRDSVPVILHGNLLLVKSRPIPLTMEPGAIVDYNKRFEEELDPLRQVVQRKRERGKVEVTRESLELSDEERDTYLKKLRKLGGTAYKDFWTENDRELLAQIEADAGERGLRFGFTTPIDYAFFWEMMYAGAPLGPVDPKQFWGFRFPITRSFISRSYLSQSKVYLQNGLLSATYLGLKYSQEEIAHIREELSQDTGRARLLQELDQLLPGDQQPEEVRDALFLQFSDEDFAYGIVHFACHARNPEEGVRKALLGFSVHGQDIWISLEDIIDFQDYKFKNRPFVFLNACGSATLGHLLESSNFPDGFFKYGAAGVIATACTMPDHFAAAFASEFYRRLLDPERSGHVYIGDVLLETRLHFLEEYNNPLGLAYGLFADINQEFLFTK